MKGKNLVRSVVGMVTLGAATLSVHGGIAIVGGDVVEYEVIPANIGNNQWQSRTEVRAWYERQTTLLEPLLVNHAGPGTFTGNGQLVAATLPAATSVQSYMIRFDPGGNNGITRAGFVEFDRPIIGVIIGTTRLIQTDDVLKRHGVSYNINDNRGMELNEQEFFEISADRLRITFSMTVTNAPTDDIRVVTEAVAASCPADLDDDGELANGGLPDNGVTISDLLYFLAGFEAGTTAADVDNGTGTGAPDAAVTVDDLLYFLARFEQGC